MMAKKHQMTACGSVVPTTSGIAVRAAYGTLTRHCESMHQVKESVGTNKCVEATSRRIFSPISRKDLHRVILAEQLRRLIKAHAASQTERPMLNGAYADTCNTPRHRKPRAAAEMLLDDVQLDAQRHLPDLRCCSDCRRAWEDQASDKPNSNADFHLEFGPGVEEQNGDVTRPTRRQRRQRIVEGGNR